VYETSHGHGAFLEIGPDATYTPIASLSLPAGSYEIQVSATVLNSNGGCCGDKTIALDCSLDGDFFSSTIPGSSFGLIGWHKASANGTPVVVTLACRVVALPGSGETNVHADSWRLTATVVGTINIQ
jgi:hypothetical protein